MDPVQTLEQYFPVAFSEVPLYGLGSLLRFSAVMTGMSLDFEDCYFWYFENKVKVVCYIEREVLDRNDRLLEDLFGQRLKELHETLQVLRSAGWRGSTVTIYGQTMFTDEDWVHFKTDYFLPQTWQAELDKKRIKPTDKLIINKVSEEQAKDFLQRKEQLAKLFKGLKDG